MYPVSQQTWSTILLWLAVLTFHGASRISAAETDDGGETRLSVHGKVVDSKGHGQKGARVYLRASTPPSRIGIVDFADVISQTETNEKGEFAFNRLAIPARMDGVADRFENFQRAVDVIAEASGFAIAWVPVNSAHNAAPITLTLNTPKSIEGIVVDLDERPVPGAEVEVVGIARISAPFEPFMTRPDSLNFLASSLRPKTKSDADGKFVIERLPAECRIHLRVQHSDYQVEFLIAATTDAVPNEPLISRLGREVRKFEVHKSPFMVKLSPGLRLRMRVFNDETGSAVPNGQIAVIHQSREWDTNVAEDGTAAIAVRDPGQYVVYYFPEARNNGISVHQPVTLTKEHEHEPCEIVIRIPKHRSLEGRVVGEGGGHGIAGVTVIWAPRSSQEGATSISHYSRAETGPDGKFRLPLLPGPARLLTDGNSWSHFIPNQMNIPPQEREKQGLAIDIPQEGPISPVQLEVSRGLVIRGSIRDAAGKGIPNMRVRASSDGHYAPRQREATSNDAGQFEISGLNPRDSYWLFSAGRDGAASHTVTAATEHPLEKSREVDVALVLQPAVVMRGRVLEGDNPLPHVRLVLMQGTRLTNNSTRYRSIAEFETGADGRYELYGLRPGDLYEIAIHTSFPAVDPEWHYQSPYAQTLPADVVGEFVLPDVRLIRLSQTLAGRVVDPDGKPVAGATVSAQLRNGESLFRTGPDTQPWTESDQEGRFRIEHLPDQPLQLMAYIPPKGADRTIRYPATVKCAMNQQDIRILLDPSLVEDK